jgi:hypothetical protein
VKKQEKRFLILHIFVVLGRIFFKYEAQQIKQGQFLRGLTNDNYFHVGSLCRVCGLHFMQVLNKSTVSFLATAIRALPVAGVLIRNFGQVLGSRTESRAIFGQVRLGFRSDKPQKLGLGSAVGWTNQSKFLSE